MRAPSGRSLSAGMLGVLGALSAFGPLSTDMYLPGLPSVAQVIVVDDHSTDDTAEVAARYPGVRVLFAPEVPVGWAGKTWACHTGAQAASPGDLDLSPPSQPLLQSHRYALLA